jgi:hypothetical protein
MNKVVLTLMTILFTTNVAAANTFRFGNRTVVICGTGRNRPLRY